MENKFGINGFNVRNLWGENNDKTPFELKVNEFQGTRKSSFSHLN
jgi:hypothetical protein